MKPNSKAQPRVHNLSVLAYELDGLARAVAAEAASLTRDGIADTVQVRGAAAEIGALIDDLQQMAHNLRYNRLTGQLDQARRP